MTKRSTYWRAIRYAIKITGYHDREPRELVHDAYLSWYESKGTSLFDEQDYVWMRVIRNTRGKQVRARHFMWHGQLFYRDMLHLDAPDFEQDTMLPSALHESTTPESVTISRELWNQVQEGLSNFDLRTLDDMVCGYLIKESIEMRETNNVRMTASVKRVKEKIVSVVGEFNLSTKADLRNQGRNSYAKIN